MILLLIIFSLPLSTFFPLLLDRFLTFLIMLNHHILPLTLLIDRTLNIIILPSFLPESFLLKLCLPLHFITSCDVFHPIHTLVIHLCLC